MAKKNLVKNKKKYFCIGFNKTGTTSLQREFEDLGYLVADQPMAEFLTDRYYFKGNFKPIIDYCMSAEVFQDIPFSYPETFKHLDKAYPKSKFILTVRDNGEQWYRSITRFHGKFFGRNGAVPTADDLRKATYLRKGFMYSAVKIHGAPDNDLYNKDIMIRNYNDHNQSVIEYFKDRPEDLLVINVADETTYQKFVNFLEVESPRTNFPWENKT